MNTPRHPNLIAKDLRERVEALPVELSFHTERTLLREAASALELSVAAFSMMNTKANFRDLLLSDIRKALDETGSATPALEKLRALLAQK